MTKRTWLLWTGLATLFVLYCGLFSPPWLPLTGVVGDLIALGGLVLILLGMFRLGALQLLLLGFGLDFLAELIGKHALSAANPLLLGSISILVGVAGVICLAAATVIGIRNKLRSV
jgi:hypothetical protein